MGPQTPRAHRTGGRWFSVGISSELKVLKVLRPLYNLRHKFLTAHTVVHSECPAQTTLQRRQRENLTSRYQPAHAAAASLAAKKAKSPEQANLVRRDPSLHLESSPSLRYALHHAIMLRGHEIWKSLLKSEWGIGPFCFSFSRAAFSDLASATPHRTTER